MKKIILSFASILIFAACSSGPNAIRTKAKESDRLRSECEQALQKAYHSTERNLAILLGFKIGMTPDEVANHFANLKERGKIYTTPNYGPTYDMATELGEIVCSFGTDFFQDSLCGIYLYLQKNKNADPSLDLPGIRKLGAMELLQKRSDLEWYITPYDEYLFINGNIVIEVKDTPQAMMHYYDAPTKRRKSALAADKKNKAIQRTAADL